VIAEAKLAFLRSSWDPPVSLIVHFINSVRAQRKQDPDGTPDYEALRIYLNQLPEAIDQPNLIEEAVVAQIIQGEVPGD
jgi:hypothetical protein